MSGPYIWEDAQSPLVTIDLANPQAKKVLHAQGSDDENVIAALVDGLVPTFFVVGGVGMALQNYHLNNKGAGCWDIEVEYAQAQPKLSFETTGGKFKRTSSIKTKQVAVPPGATPTDYEGAIGVSQHGVEGVEVESPVFNWCETHYIPLAQVPPSYIQTLYSLTARTNSTTFRGYPAGEILFMGATGGEQGNAVVEITYKFAGSPNQTGIAVYGIGTRVTNPNHVAFAFGDNVYLDGTGAPTASDGGALNSLVGPAGEFIEPGQNCYQWVSGLVYAHADPGGGSSVVGVCGQLEISPGQNCYKTPGGSPQIVPWDGGFSNTLLGRCSRPNAADEDVLVGNIDKKGWEYLWIAYGPAEGSGNALIQRPLQANVEQVYEEADLNNLGI
jgi:hypothetical protein